MRRFSYLILPVGALILLAGCGGDGGRGAAEWSQVEPAALTPAQQAQQEKALEAKNAMAAKLLEELTAALERGGPAEAIEVCRTRAPRIAAEVGRAHGVRIGRNPANEAPAWASPFVEKAVAESKTLVSEDGRLGVVVPILTAETCLRCHGPHAEIADEVKSALNEHYPDDAATGFNVGDVRGQFWVEVGAGESDEAT